MLLVCCLMVIGVLGVFDFSSIRDVVSSRLDPVAVGFSDLVLNLIKINTNKYIFFH